MGKITDISKQKRNKTRVSVYIDGEYVCGLDEVTCAAARLKIGDEITQDELFEVVKTSELNSAFERAVGYIADAPRARKEIARYLRDKGYTRETVDGAIKRMEEYRYIDDYAYVQGFIKSKSKKYGSFRLRNELKLKGIDDDIVNELLESGCDDSCLDVARGYLRSHRSADRQKLKRFLASRGFSWDSISEVVRTLGDEGAFAAPDDEEYYD